MATLLLTAVGTAFGGPIGGAIGALAGRQIDAQVFGTGSREGPRLKDLTVTTSSYGQPIARHYGTMRVGGTVIWATDLVEQRETSGGGKGKPKTTTFSYSVSFAVALSSRPIDGLGRIWADGNLLRGSAGDLKTGGTLRIYEGWGDQPLDPLLSAAEGTSCPAFRNTAYVVFEDLQLADFGNRIPALSFEVFAGNGSEAIEAMLNPLEDAVATAGTTTEIEGFSWEGGALGQTLEIVDSLHPLSVSATSSRLVVDRRAAPATPPLVLSQPATAWDDGDFGMLEGQLRRRDAGERPRPDVLRYYDIARDFQPGTQRATGRSTNDRARTIEFPGALAAGTARSLIDNAALESLRQRDVLLWRGVELDPAVQPGSVVTAPGVAGKWRVASWEWRERGVELELVKLGGASPAAAQSDAGRAWSAPDLEVTPTILRAFELPLEASGQLDVPAIFAATMSHSAGWPGASLFAEFDGELLPLETTSRTRAIGGLLDTALASSTCVRLDWAATLDITLHSDQQSLTSVSLTSLAFGANRMLVGEEIIQFSDAEQIGTARWRLSGLLRGRGGTEAAALNGHAVGAAITILDDLLVALDSGSVSGAARLAAIGPGDAQPVYAATENAGITQRPLIPVHPRLEHRANGSACLSWTRRARGAWAWNDEVEVPLVEEAERYRVGLGPVSDPIQQWETLSPYLDIDAPQWSALLSAHSGQHLWVRQIGSHAQSATLLIGALA